MSDLLNIQNLEISFQSNNKNLKTVENFSINLNEKESLGIVGESGSGKTLSMLALTRLLPKQASVSSGSIIFQNRNLDELDNKNFYKEISGKKISMIFQEPMTALNPVHTIGKQLLETYLYHNNVSVEKGIERALEILDAVKLPKYKQRMDQYPHQLSGGQRQRVMIALALINNPSLLIKPFIILATVDFPDPDSPTIAIVSPNFTSKDTFLTAYIISGFLKILAGNL